MERTEYKLKREEQEKIIRTSAADDEWEVYTADPKFIRRFEKRGYQPYRQDQWGRCYRIPLNGISIRSANRKKRSAPKPARNVEQEAVLSSQIFI